MGDAMGMWRWGAEHFQCDCGQRFSASIQLERTTHATERDTLKNHPQSELAVVACPACYRSIECRIPLKD